MRIRAVVIGVVIWAVSMPVATAATAGPRVYEYSVQGRGNTSDLAEFAAVAAETYADLRGWSLGGSVRFERVASGGDFTLWLSADNQMATFGGACDVMWSCRKGRNVVVNEDRWLNGAPAWNEAGGSLRDYRHMVVNHETGHWFGLGHASCTSPGGAAAVMQQQSMDMQRCTPNPWPLPREQAVIGRPFPVLPILTDQGRIAVGRDTGNILRA